MTDTNHTDFKEAVWDYCVKSAREEAWSRDELYAVIDSCFTNHTNSVEATIVEVAETIKIIACKAGSHGRTWKEADKMIRYELSKLVQAHTSQQVEEAVRNTIKESRLYTERRLSMWLEHKPRCYLYNEEGKPEQCDCGLYQALTPNPQPPRLV
jgi:hypothetical protein